MDEVKVPARNETRTILIQVALFLTTIVTTTIAGAELCFGRSVFDPTYTLADFYRGLEFSVPLLLILSVHEFGHYFAALYHRLKVSLPYYIPIPPGLFPFSFGTLGAIIRMRTRTNSNLQQFDVGLAGPLAGFIVALAVLWYGFATLPPPEYVFQFHPEYKTFGLNYAQHVYNEEYITTATKGSGAYMFIIGDNLVFEFFRRFVAEPGYFPNPHEMMHYPVLMAGFIALFFTCLNLLPIGQLDGGHITYGLFGGKRHGIIATVAFVLLVFYAGLGSANIHTDKKDDLYIYILLTIVFNFFCLRGLRRPMQDTIMYALVMFTAQLVIVAIYPAVNGSRLWAAFALLIGSFVGVYHPPSEIERPLDESRVALGWFTLAIFVVCFSPMPFEPQLVGFDPPLGK
jgi:membrane-associated protease RseP (regulator of RpoE activity)